MSGDIKSGKRRTLIKQWWTGTGWFYLWTLFLFSFRAMLSMTTWYLFLQPCFPPFWSTMYWGWLTKKQSPIWGLYEKKLFSIFFTQEYIVGLRGLFTREMAKRHNYRLYYIIKVYNLREFCHRMGISSAERFWLGSQNFLSTKAIFPWEFWDDKMIQN